MSTPTLTKTGNKASVAAKLPKAVFEATVDNHELLKSVYVAYLAAGRENSAHSKSRGEVSGGGKKPWRQKGTGRARFGSSRNPIWRGGGVAFGPTGAENYTHKVNVKAKRRALTQALTLANQAGRVMIIENLQLDGKTKSAANLLTKIGATGGVLFVVASKNDALDRSLRNLPNVNAVAYKYLNVFDVMNAGMIIIEQSVLGEIETWLIKPTAPKAAKKEATK